LLDRGLTAIPYGIFPTDSVLITSLDMPSIIDKVPSSKFVTYIQLADGLTAMPTGDLPTDISSNLVSMEPSITETVFDPLFVT
jgi:hypothetical protein